jgi:DNA polymerase III epsilon subunit-like protein
MVLFFDTETNGLPKDGVYPRIVQLAAILDDDGEDIEVISEVIRPDGWIIPVEASNIHGITTQYALENGVDLRSVLEKFLSMAEKADTIVCHNVQFDVPVIIQELERLNIKANLDDKDIFCTMLASTDICKIKFPNSYRPGYKWPKLAEAYRHFFKKDFDNAHDALADVNACREVYHALKSKNS